MTVESSSPYLELMKKTLSFSLWKDPGIPIERAALNRSRPALTRSLIRGLSNVLQYANLRLVWLADDERLKDGSGLWPEYADTMIGFERLNNLQFCVERALRDNIPGDFIETGVWRGGASILIRAILAEYGVTDRRVFVADSFQGLPEPDEVHYPQDKDGEWHNFDFLTVSREEVENTFRKYGLLDEQVVFLEGWFKDTLPSAPIETLGVMRLDGDMYQSTMEALVSLYPKLSEGGYCIIDDYAFDCCRQAVDDYRADNGIEDPIHRIDWGSVYWRRNTSET